LIAIVDYNMGNLASVKNTFQKLGIDDVVVESDPERLGQYDKLILPGVGAYGDAVSHLQESGIGEAVKEFAKSGKYLLGICLGMQLLFESSEEFGEHQGLGLIKGKVVQFDQQRFSHPLKVPHMGWNRIFTKEHELFKDMDRSHYLYFVHSFHAVCHDSDNTIATTEYGYEFTSAVANENVLGIQPHPEKSHTNGLKILENFISL
jgi:imidazole glycerol-phosphate synthase subunit HisH